MEEGNQWQSVSELLVHGLVMPYFHATPCSNASASDGKQEQSVFRDAPFPLSGLQFVNAICDKGDDIDEYEVI